jgi:hypothetical protein
MFAVVVLVLMMGLLSFPQPTRLFTAAFMASVIVSLAIVGVMLRETPTLACLASLSVGLE